MTFIQELRTFKSYLQSLSFVRLCNPMDCSMPGLPVHHQLPEFTISCPLSRWCHPTISSSVVHFSSRLQSLLASGSFQMSQLFASGVSSAYLRLLIFLPAVFVPGCALASPAFLMKYSAYKVNKQGDNIQPWHAPFPIWSQSVIPCPVLTVASWPAYRFLRGQVRWSGIPISSRIFHSLLWSTQSKALV